MTLDLTTLEASLKRDEELAAKATKGPWHTVDEPWLPSGQPTYVIAGHHDPHVGTLICDALEPDGFEGEDDADLERQEQEARAQSDANMAFIAHARTALLDRVKDCRELMEEVKRYRDIFAEITAKAAPLTYSEGDPERITSYSVPVGPIHRAAGKTGFQMFNGEEHLLAAVKEAREANERAKQAEAERDLWLSTWTAWQTRAAAAESSLAEAVRALEDVVARVACTDDDDYRSDLEDRLAAIGETCVAALSSLQPRKDTP